MFAPLLIIYIDYLISVAAASSMLLAAYKKRSRFALRVLISIFICAVCVMLCTMIAFNLPREMKILNIVCNCCIYLFMLAALVACSCLCFKGNFSSILFSCITGYAIKQLTENTFFLLMLIFPTLNLTHSTENNPLSIMLLRYYGIKIPFYVVYFLLLHFLWLRKYSHSIPDKETNYSSLVFASVTMAACLIFNILRDNFSAENIVMNVVCILACMLCFVLIIFLRAGILEKNTLKTEIAVIKRIQHEKMEQIDLFKENLDLINIKYHDLKKNITLLKNTDISVQDELITEITDTLNIYDAKIHTDNELLDIILIRYNLLAKRSGIRMSCIANGKLLAFMSATDLVALFSNLLENSIAASMQLSQDKRIISLSVQEECGMISIHSENAYTGSIQFKNGLPLTSKPNKAYHGFGMKSIQLITEKYDGYLTISTKNDIFRINILFPKAK